MPHSGTSLRSEDRLSQRPCSAQLTNRAGPSMIAVAAELRPEGSGGFASKSRRLGGENGFTLNALPLPDQQDLGRSTTSLSWPPVFEDWVSVAGTSRLRRIRELRRPIQPRSETYGSGRHVLAAILVEIFSRCCCALACLPGHFLGLRPKILQ
jgi:hypothetical protein